MNPAPPKPASSAKPALPDAEHRALLMFLNAAPMGLVEVGCDGTIELMNAAAARLLLPVVGNDALFNLFAVLQSRAPSLRQQVAGYTATHGMICQNLELDFSDAAHSLADTHWVSLSLMKLDPDRLMAVLSDITEQVHAEQALQRSENRLQMARNAAHVGDWELDLRTGAVMRSDTSDRIFGLDSSSPEWTLENFLSRVHPEDLGSVTHSFHEAVTTMRDWRAEFRVIWPDGSLHWVASHGQVEASQGRAERMVCILIETTAQRTAEADRLRARMLEAENRQVRESSRVKSQFLANMSHELRTPLNAIIGFAELLQRGTVPPSSPKQQQFLKHIGDSGHHLLQLINDLLDMAKVEAGKFEFTPEAVQLRALVSEVMDVLQNGLLGKCLDSSIEIDPALGPVMLDPVRLKQVFYNFLSNSIKFTPANGRVQVRVRAEDEHHLRIEVEDNGIGIAVNELDQLFVEFHQLDSTYSKAHGGTGLGLALTRRLVQAQGGRVGVRSEPGVSTVFHAVLNREHGWDAARAEGPRAQAAQMVADSLLVIEGDAEQQAGLSRDLTSAGFKVDSASDSDAAVRQASKLAYQGIALDMLLPQSGGLDTLSRIRSGSASQGSPVVGLSMPTEAGPVASFAISNLLSKPIRGDEVLVAMARLNLPEQSGMVLVVDDDPLAQDLMRVTLGAIGIKTVACLAGEEALRAVRQNPPNALILDLMMPGMNGFEVLHALRGMPEGRDLPVFIWTSMILTADEYALLARSAHAILTKGGGVPAAMVADLQRWHPTRLAGTPH